MRWKKFTRDIKKEITPRKRRILYKIEIEHFPDVNVETKTEAKKTVKIYKKLGYKARYRKIKDGFVLESKPVKIIT